MSEILNLTRLLVSKEVNKLCSEVDCVGTGITVKQK